MIQISCTVTCPCLTIDHKLLTSIFIPVFCLTSLILLHIKISHIIQCHIINHFSHLSLSKWPELGLFRQTLDRKLHERKVPLWPSKINGIQSDFPAKSCFQINLLPVKCLRWSDPCLVWLVIRRLCFLLPAFPDWSVLCKATVSLYSYCIYK